MAPLKNNIRLRGRLKRYLQTSLYLGFLLAAVNLIVYLLSISAGLVVTCFLVLYFGVVLFLQFYNRPVIVNELVSFATQYGQIQRVLLRKFHMRFWMMKGTLFGRIRLLSGWYIRIKATGNPSHPFSLQLHGRSCRGKLN